MRKLRLIDFDQVSLSSLNRHALATRADVGMSKATCLKASSLLCFPRRKYRRKPAWEGLQRDSCRQRASGAGMLIA